MDCIPNIITEKDMFYLKDMFDKNNNFFYELDILINSIKDKEIRELLERIRNMHEDHMYFIIGSLKKENCFDGDIDE